MSDWTIYLETAGDAPAITDEQLEHLVDELADHGGVVTGTPEAVTDTRYGATFTVAAADAPAAAERATAVFNGAARRAGLPVQPIVHLEVETVDETDRELARPTPRLVGIAELAELLGVTRQRASALQTRAGFPTPAAVLKSGPVWQLRDIAGFRRTWARTPGRPKTRTEGAQPLGRGIKVKRSDLERAAGAKKATKS